MTDHRTADSNGTLVSGTALTRIEVDLLHADHDISQPQLDHIIGALHVKVPDLCVFFIHQIEIPADLGTVPCGLHGPTMGDKPVEDKDVVYKSRGDRAWTDRLTDRATRPVSFVQVIGQRIEVDSDGCAAPLEAMVDHHQFRLFTIYGGPQAMRNPFDPSNPDPWTAARFWLAHALSI